MRILMLHNRYLIQGGEEQSTQADVALLREYGHDVELLERDNRDVERLGKARTALRSLWSQDSFRHVRDKLSAGNFDILHVQNFFPLWSPSVFHAAASCGVAAVQTLHNYRLLCVNSFLFRERHPCEKCVGRRLPWPGVVHACYRDSRTGSAVVAGMIGMHRMLGTWGKKVHAYIAVSEFARAKYIAGGLPAHKISVRPNFLHPSPEPGPGGGGYALFVGRLSPEKGVATMLQAWKAAHDPLLLKIVGDGPMRDAVATAAGEMQRVEYLGPRPLPEVLDLMRQSEFLVFPSEWYETMGRTIMEALAAGTPVLAARIGAPATAVIDGQTGFLFAPGEVTSMRERLEWCSRHLGEVRGLRNHARIAFEEKYTGAVALQKLLAVYAEARTHLGSQA